MGKVSVREEIVQKILKRPELRLSQVYRAVKELLDNAKHQKKPALYAELADVYYILGSHFEAIKAYKKAISLNPNYCSVPWGLPNLYFEECIERIMQGNIRFALISLEHCIVTLHGKFYDTESLWKLYISLKIDQKENSDIVANVIGEKYKEINSINKPVYFLQPAQTLNMCIDSVKGKYAVFIQGLMVQGKIKNKDYKKTMRLIDKAIKARDYIKSDLNHEHSIRIEMPEDTHLPDTDLYYGHFNITVNGQTIELTGRQFNFFGILAEKLREDSCGNKRDADSGWVGGAVLEKCFGVRGEDSSDRAKALSEVIGDIRKKFKEAKLESGSLEESLIETGKGKHRGVYRLSNNPLKVDISYPNQIK